MNIQSAISVIFGGWLVMVVLTYVIYIHIHSGELTYQYSDESSKVIPNRGDYLPKSEEKRIMEEMEEHKKEEEERREKEEEEARRRAGEEEDEEDEDETRQRTTEVSEPKAEREKERTVVNTTVIGQPEPKAEREEESAKAGATMTRQSDIEDRGGAEQARQPSYSIERPAESRRMVDEGEVKQETLRPLTREDYVGQRPLSREGEVYREAGYRPRYERVQYVPADEREHGQTYVRRGDDDKVYVRVKEGRPMREARYGPVERRPAQASAEEYRTYRKPLTGERAESVSAEQPRASAGERVATVRQSA